MGQKQLAAELKEKLEKAHNFRKQNKQEENFVIHPKTDAIGNKRFLNLRADTSEGRQKKKVGNHEKGESLVFRRN